MPSGDPKLNSTKHFVEKRPELSIQIQGTPQIANASIHIECVASLRFSFDAGELSVIVSRNDPGPSKRSNVVANQQLGFG